MKIGLCQINPIIGDVEGNKEKILQGYRKGIIEGVDLVIFPELALCGYPPQDLLEKDEFRQLIINSSKEIAEETDSVGLIFGAITEEYDNVGTGIYNSAILCYEGKIQFIQNKTLLPNYDVFDEVRYFESAKEVRIHKFKNEKLGISICEDIWNDADYWKKRRYEIDPVQRMVDKGATLLINISASPYAYGRRKERFEMLSTLTRTDKLPLAYVCCVGAQTDLIFDGGSMCFNAEGKLVKLGKTYEEDFFVFDSEEKYSEVAEIEKSFEEEVLSSLILGIRDYAVKTGFKKALIGLSGGIDSALVTYIAVQALGKDNVNVVMLPSIYSSEGSIKDSQKLIENLGIHSNIISIKEPFEILLKKLEPIFDNQAKNIAEENIQARIRGLLLMGISNKLDYLLLTTGNKSEIAVGYATLYGDMCGALAVIGDVYKTDVYRICKFINKEKEVIPIEIIEKEPSAELRPNQKDRDSLPPYEILDTILRMYLEEYKEHKAISVYIKDSSLVKKVLRLVDMNEFKRKQAAPVLRVSTKAFGYGRRFPMVHKITRI
ncbi:MAG: NAD+ synthase [Melioribacteraceae bacterium]|nr:NAD+ synthase [Melioribacteraceae bacterium]MCO6472655.1 NAD+ synthase [Melioribacteraceae bacterium]